MRVRSGTVLLILILTGSYLAVYSRAVLREGGPPAFFVEERAGVTVRLGEGFREPGIHQFYDGATPESVIEMTGLLLSPELSASSLAGRKLVAGESLDIHFLGSEVVEIKRKWMPASHRMALGIPLDPDRMNRLDWEALPGIGPRLAERIETDRQRNGDFGSLEALDRVRGIGPSRLAAWKPFF